MIGSDIYKVGIYLRLSKEDDNLKDESASIGNQRDFIHKYIREHNYLYIDEYVDDGISGTTFERPGINKLIQDIESKKINMVITKDLSRLGRNLALQLQFLDYLEDKNVNYVAILDNINTFDKSNPSNEIMSIQMFFNEKHVRDTSNKVKASMYNKRRQGNFLGSIAPYGYIKDPDNKYKLLIDEETATNVKRMFDLFVNGVGVSRIAKIFTEEGISIPSEHKNLNRGLKSSAYGIWCTRTISDILKCPTYIGILTQGKSKKVSYKSKKKVRIPAEEWILCEGACPAIIDKETFDLTQNMFLANKNQKKENHSFLLKGLVYCKECNHKITFRVYKRMNKSGEKISCYGYCNYWAKLKEHNLCTPHRIKYYDFEKLVLNDIKKNCKKYIKEQDLKTRLKNANNLGKILIDLETKKKRLEKENELNLKRKEQLYLDKIDNIIDLDMYGSLANKLTNETVMNKAEINKLQVEMFNLKNNIKGKEDFYETFIKEFLKLKNPSIQLISTLIEKIYIDEDNNVDIHYRFRIN